VLPVINGDNMARLGAKMGRYQFKTGMSRTSLYWGKNTSPEFVLDTLGIRLEPIAQKPSGERRSDGA